MAIKEKITGEQIESVLDITNKHGLFDYFFAPKESGLTEKDTKILQQIYSKRESLKQDFVPTEEEANVWAKIIQQSRKEEFEFKKTLLLNKELCKELFAVLEPETEYSIKKAPESIARGLAFLKTEMGF